MHHGEPHHLRTYMILLRFKLAWTPAVSKDLSTTSPHMCRMCHDCRLTPGIPVKPMLAKASDSFEEV
eukprot:9333-Eustigmatos_ZCMA.PRE.1